MWQAPLDPKKVSSAARLKWFPAPFHSSGRPAELVKWLANRPKLLTDDWAPQHAAKFLEDYSSCAKDIARLFGDQRPKPLPNLQQKPK